MITPEPSGTADIMAARLADGFDKHLTVVDRDLSRSAFEAVGPEKPFNMSSEEARVVGRTIGSEAFVLLRADTVRRSSFERPEYYESFAAIFVVSSRTGRLALWKLQRTEAIDAASARDSLERTITPLAAEIAERSKAVLRNELSETEPPGFDEPPADGTPAAKGFRPPVPYRRIKPEYTPTASLYDVTATVDLSIYLNEKGEIVRTEFERWAGFGLDESVERNVRSMNWRPAERSGKPFAMKFLVRYNFKKGE